MPPERRKYELSAKDVIERWAKNYPKVMTWLSKLQQQENKAWHLWLFCKTVGKDPNELLALKEDPRSTEAEVILDNFAANESVKLSMRVYSAGTVRSFFKHNYRDLAKASGVMTYIRQKPYRRHSKEELLKIYRSTQNPRDRALITFTWSTAVAKESLTVAQWSDLENDWEKQEIPHVGLPDIKVKGHGRGKWKGVEQHTFLTPEAKKDLVEYRDWLGQIKGVKVGSNDYIFVEVHPPYKEMDYGSLGAVAVRLTKRSGVPFSWHDARRYVETALEETKINPNWARKIRGRKVRGEEAPYSRPAIEQLRAAFKEAVPLLEFTQPTNLMEIQKRQEVLEKLQMKLMTGETLDPEDQANIRRYQIRLGKKVEGKYKLPDVDAAGAAIDNSVLEKFEQIPEGDLMKYLRDGWQIVHKLQNGDLVMKRG